MTNTNHLLELPASSVLSYNQTHQRNRTTKVTHRGQTEGLMTCYLKSWWRDITDVCCELCNHLRHITLITITHFLHLWFDFPMLMITCMCVSTISVTWFDCIVHLLHHSIMWQQYCDDQPDFCPMLPWGISSSFFSREQVFLSCLVNLFTMVNDSNHDVVHCYIL